MEYYLKINRTHSITTNKQVVPIDAQGVQFMKFPTASRADLQIDWIRKTGFQVNEYAIIPADQPLQIQPPTQEEAPVAEDINQLWATGNACQVNMLLIKIMEQFRGNELAVSVLSHCMNRQTTSTLELSFLTAGGFPKEKLHWITASMLDTAGLNIRVRYDEKGANYNEQFIFADSKWSFGITKNFTGIDLTKKPLKATLTRYPSGQSVFTTGAYIEPVSYTNSLGHKVFGWIVNGFEDDTYKGGQYLEVNASASFLAALTPPQDAESRDEEYIVQSLIGCGLHRYELGKYRILLQSEFSTLRVHKHHAADNLRPVAEIGTTLDAFLLDCPHFSQSAREILVDTFGSDREDVFIYQENTLLIGQHIGNQWTVTEEKHEK